nr:U3 small nucleolar ribonucleoprotein protein MPP10-like [Procambarus clarkii]
MEHMCKGFTDLLRKPEDYLRPNSKLKDAWVEQTRKVYNFLKEEEKKYNLRSPEDAMPQLYTDGLDNEQIWQLVELQNKSLLAAPVDFRGLDEVNLCFMVAKLSSLAKYNRLSVAENVKGKMPVLFDGNLDEGIGGSSDDKEEEEEEKEELPMDSSKNNEESGSEFSDDEDIFEKPEAFKDTGLDDNFGDDSDDEEDNFDELIAPEGKESEDEEEEEAAVREDNGNKLDSKELKAKGKKSVKAQPFGNTTVDTKFFKLRESEWVADNDAIGENYDLDSEDIDFMADISDESEGEEGAMYDAFFDVTNDKEKRKSKKLSELLSEDMENDEDDEEEEDKSDKDYDEPQTGFGRVMQDHASNTIEDESPHLFGNQKEEVKSTFEMERERELKVIETLEEANTSEKPWYLRGEAVSADRPENSALEEHMEYDIVARQRPVITEDTTSQVEKLIMSRIRIKAWDDVERKVKPTQDPYEYKKKLLLEQEKSKKSLAEIYEEEYLKQQKEGKQGEEEESQEHKEIKERMDKLFMKFDALANYHYTPKQACVEVKIQSNLPAINMEEATPVTSTDATLLAPQEILEPVRGELRGKTEYTSTDKKHERRVKKAHQKKKFKLQEKKLKEKLKRAGPNGKVDAKSTLKVIEKAVKSGQVKVLEGNQNKVVRSSQVFFKQLQDDASKKIQQNKKEHKMKKRPEYKSVSKFLL